MASAKATVDHDEIQRWVENRGGHPARVKQTGKKSDPGILRIDFPGYSGGDTLEEIEWDEFFEWFDRNNLAFLKQDGRSRFNKLVDRGSVKTSAKKRGGSKKSAASSKKSSGKKASASSKKASSSRKASSSSSSKKAGGSRKASSSSKKAGGSKKASKSSKKAASSSKKAASSRKASSSKKAPSSKKASSGKKASSSKKSSSSKKAAPSRKSASKKSSGRTSRSAITTTDHDEIRQWVESRGGYPATVIGTESRGEEAGLLRIDYPGFSGAGRLERISWDDFFQKFDEEKLAFLYQDTPRSRFSKLVRR